MKLKKIIFILSILLLFTSCMDDIKDILGSSATLPKNLSISITNNSSNEIGLSIRVEKDTKSYLYLSKEIGANGTGTFTINIQELYDAVSKDFPNSSPYVLTLKPSAIKDNSLFGTDDNNAIEISEKEYTLNKNAITISTEGIAWSSN